ncbi:acyltransferase family protein [Thermolongibacillus altinsuensis]|uniref:acyltransferase family protein n=1 Tax=Thermolongibacillus altinsuensis TaxID=575256 RepID=UPI0025564AFB|nr:acyltransferase family protein [Thermolongibacillus altinsuensis]
MQERDYYFDNAKFFLIILVVFGHFLRPYISENSFLHSLYNWIFFFHMPAFILISGYFAKNFHQKGYLKKVAKKILIPYLIFQLLYSLYYSFLYEENISFDFFTPRWGLWFLLSLFSWNVMLYVFAKIPRTYSLSLAVLFGLLVGFVEVEKWLSLSRTLIFFPFFLLGFLLKKKHFEWLFQRKFRVFACMMLSCIFFIVYYLFPDIQKEWLYGSKSYETLGVHGEIAIVLRLTFYAVSILMTFCFLSLIPNQKLSISSLGARTFYVYILHGFVLKYLHATEFPQFITETRSYPLLLFISIALTMILGSKPVVELIQPLVECRFTQWKQAIDRCSSFIRHLHKKSETAMKH